MTFFLIENWQTQLGVRLRKYDKHSSESDSGSMTNTAWSQTQEVWQTQLVVRLRKYDYKIMSESVHLLLTSNPYIIIL